MNLLRVIKNCIAIIMFSWFSIECYAQTTDSTAKIKKDSVNISQRAVMAYAADKFAVARPLNIEFSNASPYNFTSEKGNISFPESSTNRFTQAKVNANLRFVKRKTWSLGGSLGYRYTSLEANMTDPFKGIMGPHNKDFHYLYSSVNFTYFSTLFNKRTIYNSSLVLDGSDKRLQRARGLLTGVMVLKANRKTKISAGLAINIDPSAQIPVLPIFTYEHKFYNGLIADITVPKSAYLRKYVFSNSGRISLGVDLDRTSFYLDHIDGTSQSYEYRQTDINAGLVYEYAIGIFVLTGKTGLKMIRSPRLFRKQDSPKDPVFESRPDPTFYFNVGVSFNPFTFLEKKG